jgi:hypothetical protein
VGDAAGINPMDLSIFRETDEAIRNGEQDCGMFCRAKLRDPVDPTLLKFQ